MDSNIKRFLAYFIYSVVVAYLLFKTDAFFNQQMLSSTYSPLHFGSVLLFPIGFGILLAIPRLVSTSRQSGSWKYDWILFLAVGLPALAVELLACFSLLPLHTSTPFTGNVLFYHSNLVFISGIVLGYILLAAIKKAYSWF